MTTLIFAVLWILAVLVPIRFMVDAASQWSWPNAVSGVEVYIPLVSVLGILGMAGYLGLPLRGYEIPVLSNPLLGSLVVSLGYLALCKLNGPFDAWHEAVSKERFRIAYDRPVVEDGAGAEARPVGPWAIRVARWLA